MVSLYTDAAVRLTGVFFLVANYKKKIYTVVIECEQQIHRDAVVFHFDQCVYTLYDMDANDKRTQMNEEVSQMN